MNTLVNINGEILNGTDARISVFDRGFLYGDSVFEVLRTYGGRLFAFEDHWQRLNASAGRIGILIGWNRETMLRQAERTVQATGNDESYVRIVVTRGAGDIGLDTELAAGQSIVVLVQPLRTPPAEWYRKGVKVGLSSIARNPKEALDPAIKSGNYLNNILALAEARKTGCVEAVMMNGRGMVAECTTSNIFIVQDGAFVTPPAEAGILHGITRKIVLGLAKANGLPAYEREFSADELLGADECFLTSSLREVLPITRIDDTVIGDGSPAPLTLRMMFLFSVFARGGGA